MKTLVAVVAASIALATPSIAAELISKERDRTVFFMRGSNIVPKDECRGNSSCSRWVQVDVIRTYERKDGSTFTRTSEKPAVERNRQGNGDGGSCRNCQGGGGHKK